MKTNIMYVLLCAVCMHTVAFAQHEGERQLKLKIEKDIDGIITKVDTTIFLSEGDDPQQIMQLLQRKFEGQNDGNWQDFEFNFEDGNYGDDENAGHVYKKFRWFDAPPMEENSPFLGIIMNETSEIISQGDTETQTNKITIERVVPQSAADLAGLQAGDVLLRMDDNAVSSAKELRDYIKTKKVGDNVNLTYEREGKVNNVAVVLQAFKANADGMSPPAFFNPHDFNWIMKHPNMSACMDKRGKDCCRKDDDSRAFLGVYPEKICDETYNNYDLSSYLGVLVKKIVPEGAAEKAGMRVNDIIVEIDNINVNNPEGLRDILQQYQPNDKITITYLRDGKTQTTKLILGEKELANKMPEDGAMFQMPLGEDEIEMNFLPMGENANTKIKIEDWTTEDARQFKNALAPDNDAVLFLDGLEYYPNPNRGVFTLNLYTDRQVETTIRIVDAAGKEIYKEIIPNFEGFYSKAIDISRQNAGIYLLQIMQNDSVLNRKLIIER
ncbi:MAG: PDZ domain-containing protein [Chitinophagales bacterium]|nr:PDZ domain-containing protein [Bacteroidota bacterium]